MKRILVDIESVCSKQVDDNVLLYWNVSIWNERETDLLTISTVLLNLLRGK